MKKLTFVLLATVWLAACTGKEDKATSLYVDAARLVTQAQGASDEVERYETLSKAKGMVETIITDYSSTSAATLPPAASTLVCR